MYTEHLTNAVNDPKQIYGPRVRSPEEVVSKQLIVWRHPFYKPNHTVAQHLQN